MNGYLVITELFLPTKGGTAVWFAEVYRRLGGKEIHIITADVPGAREIDADHPNSIHRLALKRVSWLRPESLLMYTKLLLASLGLALTHRFKAIHAGRALPEGLVAWFVARLTFCKLVVYAHGEELTSWGRGRKFRAMKFALTHADAVIANSEFTRQELHRMGVAEGRIELIHPGVDVERFRPGLPYADLRQSIGIDSAQSLVLSVGRLQRRKGFDTVIRSLPQLIEKGIDVYYAIIGIGEDKEFLLALSQELGVSDRVLFLGHVSDSNLPRWYGACDVFAMPNRDIDGDTEGFGMVFIEAGACGKPVIAGQSGGTGSAVRDGETGIRVDGASVGAVTNGLADLLLSLHKRQLMGKAGRARAEESFSWDTVAHLTRSVAG